MGAAEAVLLSADDLSYLDHSDGQILGSQPSSTSYDSDEFMGLEEDDEVAYVPDDDSFSPWTEDMFAHDSGPSSSAGPSNPILIEEIETTIARFREFKQFDTVVDHSDNYFVKSQNPRKFSLFRLRVDNLFPQVGSELSNVFSPGTSKVTDCVRLSQPQQMTSKEWTRHIQHEWSILEKDLPGTWPLS